MDRRAFVLVGLAGIGLPRATLAQQAKKLARIGYLSATSAAADKTWIAAFQQGLRELGYVEGETFIVEPLHAAGRPERLPELAEDLVRRKVDIIVVYGTLSTRAAKKATSTIPIVMAVIPDPVGSGLVASLARPGANVTGVTNLNAALGPKRLELLKGVVPSLSRVAALSNPTTPANAIQLKDLQAAAPGLGLKLIVMEATTAEEVDEALTGIAKQRLDALVILGDPIFNANRIRIAEFALKNRLPTIGTGSHYTNAGCLMSYGTNFPELYRRAAVYVDKILKGAKPGDLPIEQPTKFELAINLKTAKAIGVTIPASLLVRADEVIQ